MYTDGGARGNPGPAASGYAIFGPAGEVLDKGAKTIGRRTNNEAEYEALIWAIQRAKAISVGDVRFHSDSELMVRQVNGVYQVKKEHLRVLVERVKKEAAGFRSFRIVSLPREDERIQLVDALVNDALDGQGF
ncbi:MAG: ribonuclease [Candidatus Thermoplasmatota archaeon]|nr:ribonuclease [Candidatus Thermoplasmatota archaeon]